MIVDNEEDLRDLVALHLENAGMSVSLADSGSAALCILEEKSFDLIILDIMMEEPDGFEVLQRLRSLQLHTPVLLLSAKHEEKSKVYGFGLGADDYVTKPFSPAELVARAQAHIRRFRQPYLSDRMQLRYERFTLDVESQTIYKAEKPIPLSATETKLLYELMRRPNQAIAKMELFEQVWGHSNFDDNSLTVYIKLFAQKN